MGFQDYPIPTIFIERPSLEAERIKVNQRAGATSCLCLEPIHQFCSDALASGFFDSPKLLQFAAQPPSPSDGPADDSAGGSASENGEGFNPPKLRLSRVELIKADVHDSQIGWAGAIAAFEDGCHKRGLSVMPNVRARKGTSGHEAHGVKALMGSCLSLNLQCHQTVKLNSNFATCSRVRAPFPAQPASAFSTC